MSFDLYLQAFAGGMPGPGDRRGFDAALQRYDAGAQDAFNHRDVTLRDGSSVELIHDPSKPGLSCAVLLRSEVTEAVAAFVHDLARSGNMAILSPQADEDQAAAIVTPGFDRAALPDDEMFARVPEVASAAELRIALTEPYAAWESYRAHALGSGKD